MTPYRPHLICTYLPLYAPGYYKVINIFFICNRKEPRHKYYQHDARLQNVIRRSGAFTIASNCIMLALCSFAIKDNNFINKNG